ncbi:hypothetical protein PoB_006735100 [Plakobranchus ocellatus]|uniref:Uncharacterized protein n=1 Tax=Plakobranchus ocellatus TaxID=259542 RepID=A0AAV4DA89_9GAST|nr:hypothetical protein PoB_006735100 [Plakobranchus ocellatus]
MFGNSLISFVREHSKSAAAFILSKRRSYPLSVVVRGKTRGFVDWQGKRTVWRCRSLSVPIHQSAYVSGICSGCRMWNKRIFRRECISRLPNLSVTVLICSTIPFSLSSRALPYVTCVTAEL